jgi:hypothetical protein
MTDEAVKIAKEYKFNLTITGHSLGAWLAEQGAFFCSKDFNYFDVKVVTFDSPGSYEMVDKMKSNIISNDSH